MGAPQLVARDSNEATGTHPGWILHKDGRVHLGRRTVFQWHCTVDWKICFESVLWTATHKRYSFGNLAEESQIFSLRQIPDLPIVPRKIVQGFVYDGQA